MKPADVRNMRLRQAAVTNGLILAAMMIFYIITNAFTLTSSNFFFIAGMLMLLQGAYGFFRGQSVKSPIPIFEQVAIYEKEKLGREWDKKRQGDSGLQLVLGCLFFLQSYWSRHSPEHIVSLDLITMIIIVCSMLLMINISMIMHFRKVDRAASESELKGFTRKSNLTGVAVGLVFAIILFIVTISYVAS